MSSKTARGAGRAGEGWELHDPGADRTEAAHVGAAHPEREPHMPMGHEVAKQRIGPVFGRTLSLLAALLPAGGVVTGGETRGDRPRKSETPVMKLDYGTELFVDDLLIDRMRGVKRTLHPATKSGRPVLAPERPWELGGANKCRRILLYGTVLFDGRTGKYRMWYMCRMGPLHGHKIPGLYMPRPRGGRGAAFMGRRRDKYGRVFADNDRGDLTCYAESSDGVHWPRPNAGVFEFNGDAKNNIVWDFHGACVFRDEEASDPKQRYKAIGFCRRYRNVFLLTSGDGVRWDDSKQVKPVLQRRNEGTFNVVWDPRGAVYRAYAHGRDRDKHKRRMVYYSQSRKLSGPWKPLEPMLRPDKADDETGRRKCRAIRAEYHNMSGFPYGRIHIGILGVLYVTGPGAPRMPVDGPIDAVLIYSRDGMSWRHFDKDRTPIIPRGRPGSFDGGMIMGTAREPVIDKDKVHWYYTGANCTHGAAFEKKVMSLGRATWRLDGFVSLDAGPGGGVVETVPLRLPPGELEVNADAAGGTVSVEILTAEGKVQPGFSASDCKAIRGDSVRHRVRWSRATLAQAKQPLRLRFLLKSAKLYAFRLKRK